jgi:hypothetical protein
MVRRLADELCGGRVAFVLEGGYAASGLRAGVDAVLSAIVPRDAPPLPPVVPAPEGSVLRRVVGRVAEAQGGRFADLGAA